VVDPSSGTTTGSSEVTIRAVDFSMDYTGTVTFENKDNPSDTATVQITVTGSPDLAVSHSSVRVSCSEPTMTIEVLNTGGGTLSWTASLAGGGLVVTPTSDTTREATAVSISTNSIDCQGPYTTYLTFTNSNDATDTEVVAVSVGPDAFTIELIPDVTLRMVWIPRGTFLMGRYSGEQDSLTNEDPQHEVTLSQGFWMGRYELTKAQWTAVMGTEPWSGRSYVLDDPDTPATHVDWGDIQDYIEDLNTLTQLAFRLPTEAEWEYACRAETTSRFYWGNDSDHTRIGNYAWWYDNAEGIEERYAHIVGKKYDNDFGLYDMSGNVWEFCQDWYAAYPNDGKPVTDPTGPSSGTTRVIRGGGWGSEAKDCRSARRMRASELSTNINMAYRSFRLAR
jgi:formylglycine-generating enzyme required for sulfatase activity